MWRRLVWGCGAVEIAGLLPHGSPVRFRDAAREALVVPASGVTPSWGDDDERVMANRGNTPYDNPRTGGQGPWLVVVVPSWS